MRTSHSKQSQWFEEENKLPQNKFVKKTWLLLLVVWALCLIPIPLTGPIALVINFAAFVMSIVTLAKGDTKHGVYQLLSVFLLTPLFYFFGILIFASFVTNSLDLNNLSKRTVQEAINDNIRKELSSIYNTEKKDKMDLTRKSTPYNHKPKPSPKAIKGNQIEKIKTFYITYTKDGGEVSCKDLDLRNETIIMKTSSGMTIEIDKSEVEKIEKYQVVNKKTKKSSWVPSNG